MSLNSVNQMRGEGTEKEGKEREGRTGWGSERRGRDAWDRGKEMGGICNFSNN